MRVDSDNHNRRYILASASPRRKELLSELGIAFDIIPSDYEEDMSGNDPEKMVEKLSYGKAADVYRKAAEADKGQEIIVIGADTVVACDGRILGKPHDRSEAMEMIHLLGGRRHDVFTGVTVIWGEQKSMTFHSGTSVEVYPISEEEAVWYTALDEPYDKAGGYGIQGSFMRFVKGIEGDYNNVVGLPVAELYQKMKKSGLL